MLAFPSPCERIAASALLLLSAKSDSEFFCSGEDDDYDELIKENSNSESSQESLVSSDSKSISSSLTSDDGSSEQINKQGLKIIAAVARFHALRFEVVRKSRSKQYRSSDLRKLTSGEPTSIMFSGTVSESTGASCLSSSSSAVSSARSGFVIRGGKKEGMRREEMKRKSVGSTHMRRRAEAIMRILSDSCASEVTIRQVLGDSPDTSKALRMLLKHEDIKRSGAGGRTDPYIYTIAQ